MLLRRQPSRREIGTEEGDHSERPSLDYVKFQVGARHLEMNGGGMGNSTIYNV